MMSKKGRKRRGPHTLRSSRGLSMKKKFDEVTKRLSSAPRGRRRKKKKRRPPTITAARAQEAEKKKD